MRVAFLLIADISVRPEGLQQVTEIISLKVLKGKLLGLSSTTQVKTKKNDRTNSVF